MKNRTARRDLPVGHRFSWVPRVSSVIAVLLVMILLISLLSVAVSESPPQSDPATAEKGGKPSPSLDRDRTLVLIPAGEFWMGDHSGVGTPDERPLRRVHVPDFYLSRNEVRFAEWQEVHEWAIEHGYAFENKGRKGWSVYSSNERHPVTIVNWYDVVKWCNARSEMEGLRPVYYEDDLKTKVYRTGALDLKGHQMDKDAGGYRLPTEAEWEKAARGGLVSQFFPWKGGEGEFKSQIDPSKANYWPFVQTTSESESYPANEYGLHDMAGNVWEWCWDLYDPDVADSESTGEIRRALRGGGWRSAPYLLRCSSRDGGDPGRIAGEWGFRCGSESA